MFFIADTGKIKLDFQHLTQIAKNPYFINLYNTYKIEIILKQENVYSLVPCFTVPYIYKYIL